MRDNSVIGTGPVEVQLLGHPAVSRAGQQIALPSRNTLLLLARLAVEGPQSRETLAALLWPDAGEDRARTNLRRTLAYLRESCGRDVAAVAHASSSLALTDAVVADIHVVRQALAQPVEKSRLSEAIDLWRGEFLEGVGAEGEDLDSWLRLQRQTWHQRLTLAAETLVAALSDAGDAAAAWNVVDRWLNRDPLSEAAQRERIRLHLLRGDRVAALEAYQHCASLLRRELDVAPSRELEALAAMARSDAPITLVQTSAAYEVRMVGRERQHASLASAFHRAVSHEPMLALVAGEPGIGKTRLVIEFTTWAMAHGAHVLQSHAFPSAHRIPYGAVAETFAEALTGDRGGQATSRSPAQVAAAVAELVLRRAASAPLVLVMEDLHWLDPDTLEVLLHTFSTVNRQRAPVLFVATARDDDLAGSTGLRDWIARAAHELRFVEVPLIPLSIEETEELVRLWPDVLVATAAAAVQQAAGRPLLIVETLRYLADGGDPETIAPAARESMQARLRALSPAAAMLAGVAAVVEQPADLAMLRDIAGLSQRRAATALEELLRKHILAGFPRYAFCHELLRRAAYSALPTETRRALHARAALALDKLGDVPSEVARHAELAGHDDLAWERRLQAAREASSVAAHRVAADQLRAAIALRPDYAAAWLELGRAEELSGHSDLAADTYRRLVGRARRAGRTEDEAAGLVRLSELAGRELSGSAPMDLFQEAADAAREAENDRLQVEAKLAAAQVDAYRGHLERAAAALQEAAHAAYQLGNPELIARCLNLDAFISQGRGLWQRTLDLARDAQHAYRALEDPVMELDSLGYELAALVFLGQWQDAIPRARRAMVQAERLENPWAISNVCLSLAWALRDGGLLQDAVETARRGQLAAAEAGFLPLQLLNGAIEGRCRRELKDVAGALETHSGLVGQARQMEGVAYQAVTEELCADHAAAQDWSAAAHWAEESAQRWGEMNMFTHLCLWTVMEAFLRAGKRVTLPVLPRTPRYVVVELRAKVVVAACSGQTTNAERLLREALAVAESLQLAVEAAELREQLSDRRDVHEKSSRR